MKTQIKKGDKFLCKLDYLMNDGKLAYRQGDIYNSPSKNQLSSILHFDHGQSIIDEEFLEHFELIKENPIQHDDFNEHTKEIPVPVRDYVIDTPKHYDNSKGSLYKVAAERNWNPYIFDIVKRLERAEKKGEFENDLNKSIAVIQLWLKENNND